MPPQITNPYTPQHVNSNRMYVAATVMQPVYPPQGYQIPVAYAYPGHGDHYTANFPNKINQNAVPAQKTIVTVNNYMPPGSVAVQVPQPVILQKPPQSNVSMHPVIMPQPYVTVAAPVHPVTVSQTNANVVHLDPVEVNPPQIVPPTTTTTNTVPTASASVSPLPQQTSNSRGSLPEKAQFKTPLIKQNGTESNASPQNKSWASLFNSGKNNEAEKTENVLMNGCAKNEQSPVITEECDHEFAAIKKELREKYDDPTYFRIGGKLLLFFWS